ncbi:hypothetical protein PLICRDRAFT_116530 [Plicaturopsis crispa FD-325 SS-3]|uniref:DUF6589 domain-containing protein n=1 Tax=Plicaturopsis crispa FD-325 SS-3 TaxID=944288 RepID=A0A0C9SRX0_PLICR|nr:hypothetical protein PLICRDRAFT_116530 [Plicaturopsis crispa FD-325 SS-3]
MTSPITGTRAEQTAQKKRKQLRKRAKTLAAAHVAREAAEVAKDQEARDATELAAAGRINFLDGILESLASHRLTLGDLMLHVFDPIYKHSLTRWEGFFRDRSMAPRILDLWTSNENSLSARTQVHDWAVKYIRRVVHREAKSVTASADFRSTHRPMDAKFVLDFSMKKMHARLRELATVSMDLFAAFATSARQLKEGLPARMLKKSMVITSSALQLLGEYSYANNYAKRVMGLYFFATGTQRQTMTVASHLGLTESYNNLTAKPKKKKQAKASAAHPTEATDTATTTTTPSSGPTAADHLMKVGRAGTLRTLSGAMVGMARGVAATGLFAASYDNINMVFRAAEQILGRTDTQENGTCSTIWPLWKAKLEDMLVSDLTSAFDRAPPLSIFDILLNEAESQTLDTCLVYCVLRIIITHGGEKFAKFREELELSAPATDHLIEVHRTPLHPLPPVEIDESTIVGNSEVIDATFDVLWIKRIARWLRHVKFFAGDQLSIARLRALVNIRAGHEGGYEGYGWGVWIPGLFHAKIADMHGFFVTHWGKPNAGTRNPGCLAFHNTVLHRHPILLTSLPPFRTCRDLVFVSLYARVLHLLLLVSHKSTLDEYINSVDSWATLKAHSLEIVTRYTDSAAVDEMRWQRETTGTGGDMVYENAVLFLRDALLSREFTDAIKCGDSGRVVLILKVWALGFRGSGRTKYAHEMLHLCHNIAHVWPKGIRDIVFNNWLVNPSGRPNAWVEVDLMQEHMNFWIKNFYQAHGSSASWDWLGMIGPCVNILRHLVTSMNNALGSYQGNRHATLNLKNDIPELMRSLADHEVYLEKGRVLDEDDKPTVDIIGTGLRLLTDASTNPLHEYNTAFQRLQARRRLTPIVGEDDADPASQNPTPLGTADSLPSGSPLGSPRTDDAADGDFEASDFPDDEEAETTLSRDTAADVSLDMDAEDMGDQGDDPDGFFGGGMDDDDEYEADVGDMGEDSDDGQ